MSMPVIEAEGLVCRIGERTTLAVPRLVVRPGERIGLIGPNGAGKSTLLRCLGGFVRPAEGRLRVAGTELAGPAGAPGPAVLRALRAEVGQVLQGLHPVQRLSALENVLIGALPRVPGWRSWARWFPADEVAAAEAALRSVGLGHLARVRSDRLSGGERQKLAIARMLLQRPRLILADEPTASLDPQAATEVCALLATAAQGATLLTVVHNPALLPLLADRVLGLRQGELLFDLPMTELDEARLSALYESSQPGVPSSPERAEARRPALLSQELST